MTLILMTVAFVSMGGLKEQLENYQPSSEDERVFRAVAPDAGMGQAAFSLFRHGASISLLCACFGRFAHHLPPRGSWRGNNASLATI